MSSFTPKEIRGLHSAYTEVHMSEEGRFLSSLLEEINYAISDMVEEGWDLSEYTWEELQESFLDTVILPEIERFNDVVSQLNESNEELTEEQQEEFILEWGWLTALSNIGKAKKAADAGRAVATATKTAQKVKPNILQAPLVGSKPSVPAASTAPLQAPVKPVKPTKPLPSGLSSTGGATQAGKPGLVTQAQNWVGGLFKAKPPAASAAPKSPSGTPKPSGYKPTNLRGVDLRPTLSAIRSTSGKLKAATYDKLPQTLRRVVKGATVATLASPLLGVAGRDVYRAATGGPSVTQTAAARAQQAYGVGEIGLGKLQGIVDPVGGQETVQSGQANVRSGSQSIADVKRKERERSMQGRTSRTSGTTGLPIYQHYEVDLDNKESINEVLVQGKDGKWYDAKFDKNGKKISQVEVSPTQAAIDRYNRLKNQQKSQPQPAPAKPRVPSLPPSAAQPGSGPKGNEVGSKPAPAQPAKPAPAPAQPSGGGGGGGRSTPSQAPAPAKPAPAAPKPSPVADYMKAAAAARKSGDPAEMAKVRDMGMDIWRKSNPKLAAAADERARIRGTAQTDNPLMKDMRSRLPLTPSVQAPEVKNLGSGQQSLAQNPNAAVAAAPKMPELKVSTDKEMAKTSDALSKNPLKKEVKKEAYDIILDYIISEGHAENLSEAHYVMMQMDSEHIQNIVQERWSWNPMDWGKPEATPKNVARETPTRGYNPNTGTTKLGTPQTGYKDHILASRGGVAGAMVKGKPETWVPVNSKSQWAKDAYARYRVLRGEDQLAKDDKNNAYVSAVTKDFDRRHADVYRYSKTEREGLGPAPTAPRTTPRPAATTPAAPKPKPQPPTIQSKNVTATGTSYERRTPTSAELAASRAAGGGEAGIKAAIDVAKTNKVASTSPTPDLKPEAPKKRESLAAQVKELQTMRKAAEERNK